MAVGRLGAAEEGAICSRFSLSRAGMVTPGLTELGDTSICVSADQERIGIADMAE